MRSGCPARIAAGAGDDRTRNGVALPASLVKQLDELAANLKIKPLGAR